MDAQEKLRRDEIYSRYVKTVLPRFATDIEASKAEFKSLCEQYITSNRKNSLEKIFNYLEKTDFYTAPSSTVFHLNCPGGLCRHSINVFKAAKDICDNVLHKHFEEGNSVIDHKIPMESIAISALFHDLCKIGMYYPDEKFTKDSMNRWVKYLGWGIDDQLPMGHAEKSLYRLSRLIELMPEEILAIRWHMGMYDMGEKGTSLRNSFYSATDMSPLVTVLHMADSYAAKCLEPTYDLKEYTL
ncbi:MAG: hypothetical protein MJZ32_06295 [Bacteroidaceae bacterium]|nr:hypothetical protein [Bacteroidaceae bacterium]